MGIRRHRRKRSSRGSPGAPPGTLLAPADAAQLRARIVRYGDGPPVETALTDARQVLEQREGRGVLWVDIVGRGNLSLIQGVGEALDLHRLTLEDIVSIHQRPKVEDFSNYAYIVLRVPGATDELSLSQLSLVVGKGYLASFEQGPQPCLEPVRQRIREQGGLVTSRGADYLAYAIIDSAVDHFFPLLDRFGDRLDEIESAVLQHAGDAVLADLYAVKEDLRECRRSVSPLRDVLSALSRREHPWMQPETAVFLRDCHDNVVQVLELIDSERDTATALMDLHVSRVGNRMNEVMKVLTIIATLFIPLSFIASLYGMNFDTQASPLNMPELRWHFGYPAVLLVMLVVAVTMLAFFRHRGWLGRRTARSSSVEGRENTGS